MSVLYVTSLNEGDGKTALCASMAHLLKQQGHTPMLLKAVAFVPTGQDPDAQFYASLQFSPPSTGLPKSTTPQQGIAPQIREEIANDVRQVSSQGSPVIVEGPPIVVKDQPINGAQALAEELDAKVIMVARYSPTMQARDITDVAESFGERLLGVVINGMKRYLGYTAQTTLATSLAEREVPLLGIVPEERSLFGVTVAEIAEHLDGELLLNPDKGEQLIDNLMIGGMVLDWGVHYFSQSETKAVIVRGDRPDIQMAALHTPTRCLVLTGGHHPLQYVAYEAREEEVPVIVVKPGTLDTAKAVEALFDNPTVHHKEKVERLADVLSTNLDLEAVMAAIHH